MNPTAQKLLARWVDAGLIDAAAAERIGAWESTQPGSGTHSRLAGMSFGLGGLMLVAGVMLFVSANWDAIGPLARFALVLAALGSLHTLAALASARQPALATALHAAGTALLGAGIFLTGQIFNLAEHWPTGLLLWALGATVALCLLRDWPHVIWVALLAPAWMWSEWIGWAGPGSADWTDDIPAIGILLLTLGYLSAARGESDLRWRRLLTRLGALMLIPSVASIILLAFAVHDHRPSRVVVHDLHWATGCLLALLPPALLTFALRGRQALLLVPALLWALVLARVEPTTASGTLITEALCALAATGVIAWGVREQVRACVTVGVEAFALTVFAFYYSNLFDKLDRSLGLISVGVIFIGGGWLLARVRNRLLAGFTGPAS